MHTAVVAQFEIAANDPQTLKRFYASLFGWRIRTPGSGALSEYVIGASGDGVEGAITYADPAGVRIVVEVDDVLENLSYAEELGGRIIELPHEIACAGRRVTVATFSDPEGNRVRLSNRLQQSASAP